MESNEILENKQQKLNLNEDGLMEDRDVKRPTNLMIETGDNSDTSDNTNENSILHSGDSPEDIDEPKLSYERILNDLSNIIRTDSITSSCLHNKFFAIGTLYGRIHVFDHQGNKVDRQELFFHIKSVNCISIDDKGEYLASSSADRLVVYGLFNSEYNLVLNQQMNVIAIDPQFHRTNGGKSFVAADHRVVLYERNFLGKYKQKVLHTERKEVKKLSWHKKYIAWATDAHVKIFDLEEGRVFTQIKPHVDIENDSHIKNDGDVKNQCQLYWKESGTLLIGWSNTIRVCLIKDRPSDEIREGKPKKYVEIISIFSTDFTICGLAPFNNNLLTLSINNPKKRLRKASQETHSSCDSSLISIQSSSLSMDVTQYYSMTQSETSTSSTPVDALIRPQVQIIETFPSSYNELSRDILTPNGCPTVNSYNTSNKSRLEKNMKNFPFSLLSLHNDGLYFIVCPKDVISAKPRDHDDHIDWLIQHSMLKEAYTFAKENLNNLRRHSVREIEELYMKELLERATSESYREAAKLCSSICGTNIKSWNETIQKFCDLNQLEHLLPYLPRRVDDFHLSEDTYNFILNDFLKNDPVSFYTAIKEIPSQLYSLQAITDQVHENLANDPKNLVLHEALAELYTRMGRFEEAVNIYLDYNDKKRIFSLIRENNLVSILKARVDKLMHIDASETSQLLVENMESIKMNYVVEKLEKRYLVSYFHKLVLKDPDSCIEYHDMVVKLYAQYQRESLLKFLKLSNRYRLDEALRICKEENLIKEVVFLCSRMGDLRTALKYITESQSDDKTKIKEAIEFCEEHQDPELWQDLILYSMDKPKFIGALLENIGTHINDPIELIDRIPNGCEIDGLIDSLKKILQDYQLQISLEQSYRDLMATDCFSLLRDQIRCQTQGIAIKEDQLCDHCKQPLLSDAMLADNLSQTRSLGPESSVIGAPSGSKTGQLNSTLQSNLNDLVVFGCHHVFHEECCADSATVDSELSTKLLTCRACMLKKDY